MLYVMFDIEILDEPAFLDLADTDPGHPWRYLRLVQIAKRANEKGRVLSPNGIPLDARSLSRVHEGRGVSPEVWEQFLAQCLNLSLLAWDDLAGCYQVTNWRRWHRPPSSEPEAVAERVARHRERRKTAQQSQSDDNGKDVTTCNESVTNCNGCNDSEQSRAEQSTVTLRVTEQSIAKQGEFVTELSDADSDLTALVNDFDFARWLIDDARPAARKIAAGYKLDLTAKDESAWIRCLRSLKDPTRDKIRRCCSAFQRKLRDMLNQPDVQNPWGFCCSKGVAWEWLTA